MKDDHLAATFFAMIFVMLLLILLSLWSIEGLLKKQVAANRYPAHIHHYESEQ